jgi:hypothetical protein
VEEGRPWRVDDPIRTKRSRSLLTDAGLKHEAAVDAHFETVFRRHLLSAYNDSDESSDLEPLVRVLLTASFPISVTHNLRWIGSPLARADLRMARKVLPTDRRSARDQNCPPNYPPKGVFLVLKLKFYTKISAP